MAGRLPTVREQVLGNAPTWLDRTGPPYGAPPFLWTRLTTQADAEVFRALLGDPEAMQVALVETWQAWRAPFICGEWEDGGAAGGTPWP